MKTRHLNLLTLVVGASLLAVGATDADANRGKRIEFLNGGQGVRSLPIPDEEGSQDGGPAAVRVEGVARWDSRDGLRVGKTTVNIGPSAAVFPSSDAHSALLDPASLDGRQITVFGRRSGSRVEAVLVITSGSETEHLRSLSRPVDRSHLVPSEVDPRVGELRTNVPE